MGIAIRRDLTALSTILRSCVGWGWLESNPARDFDRSHIKERRDPIRLPTDENVTQLLAICPPPFAACIKVLAATGMRQEEAVSLEWSQVDLKRCEILLTRTKSSRARIIPLYDPLCSDAVSTLSYTAPHYRSPYVFWHADGQRYQNFSSLFSRRVRAVGLRFRAHDLRHKFAVDYLRATGDIYRLSKILGHASVKTTEIYLQFVDLDRTQNRTQGDGLALIHRLAYANMG